VSFAVPASLDQLAARNWLRAIGCAQSAARNWLRAIGYALRISWDSSADRLGKPREGAHGLSMNSRTALRAFAIAAALIPDSAMGMAGAT
jgi:hypothetical protein